MGFQIVAKPKEENKFVGKILLEQGKCDLKMLMETLREDQKKLSTDQILYFLLKVATGLDVMRKIHRCHLDIKPQNIMIIDVEENN